jgi:FkbH-like protein
MFSHDASHLDYFKLLKERKRLDTSTLTIKRRVAVLADFSTQQLVPLLEILFARAGIAAKVHEGEFSTIETEVFDPASSLWRFEPEVVLLLRSTNALRDRYYGTEAGRADLAEVWASEHVALWDAIAKTSKALVVQSTYVEPYERTFGHYELKVPESLGSVVRALNAKIVERARSKNHVLLCDVDAIASYVGKKTWCDERLWGMAKTPCALEHLPRMAQGIVDVVASTAGKQVKCVVLDLDNTVWGGIIGDDGLEGIQIGHFGEGEPFYRFQCFARELKRRGIILAVCSKNEHDTAIRAFREHPEMALRENDIAVFVANWDTKVDNLRRIQETLNIGFDSMVFVDDNPFERNIVRQYLPDVIVPEMPEEPADYVRALAELNLFETSTFTEEDRARADLYREESARRSLEKSFTNVEDYLRSLEMRVTVSTFDDFHLPRIAQLIQRSNQFNLTTRRHTLADCERIAKDPAFLPLYVKLADKFGDYGLISVVIAKPERDRLDIDTWLMSCRVLSRGVEEHAMNRVVQLAKERGLPLVVGEYIPTPKNKMVKDFYARFGFKKAKEDESGRATWVLDVGSYEPRATFLNEATA